MIELKKTIQSLPDKSGVYQYFDKSGKILYIGKAKSLKNRVKSYFRFTPTLLPNDTLSPRIYKMISEVVSLEYIIVPSENDALILENSLIKQLKPKYNILLRDDKTYPYIYINYDEDFPRPDITRKIIKSKNIKYYGPYSSGARDILNSIYALLPLVQKKSCLNAKKECLFYQIKRCLAPCVGKVTKQEYRTILDSAADLINNKSKLISLLEHKMQEYSSNLQFEEALDIKNKISSINRSQITTGLDFANLENLDLFASYIAENRAVVVKMFIRDGKLVSSTNDFIKLENETYDIEEIYKRAIIEYYSNHEILLIPDSILIADEISNEEVLLLKEFLYSKLSKNIDIINPKIGKKREIAHIAIENCKELLRISLQDKQNSISLELKKLLELNLSPQRIEIFDNSHLQGYGTVGAMVVYQDGKWDKSSNRLYHLEAKDEYSQMKETLMRRANSFAQNPAPDLWIIDGGKTLLNLAKDIISSVGVDIDIISIAKEKIDAKANRSKGKANDIIYTQKEVFKLQSTDNRLQFIQKLRDEAHRVAIGFHKKTKLKEDKQISLLAIKGIGEAKVKKLLLHFGSFENIKKSEFLDLKEILNEKDALSLIEYFKLKQED